MGAGPGDGANDGEETGRRGRAVRAASRVDSDRGRRALGRQLTEWEEKALPSSLIVAAIGNDVVDDVGLSADTEVVRIGDCVAPRTVLEAIRDGRLAGLAI